MSFFLFALSLFFLSLEFFKRKRQVSRAFYFFIGLFLVFYFILVFFLFSVVPCEMHLSPLGFFTTTLGSWRNLCRIVITEAWGRGEAKEDRGREEITATISCFYGFPCRVLRGSGIFLGYPFNLGISHMNSSNFNSSSVYFFSYWKALMCFFWKKKNRRKTTSIGVKIIIFLGSRNSIYSSKDTRLRKRKCSTLRGFR